MDIICKTTFGYDCGALSESLNASELMKAYERISNEQNGMHPYVPVVLTLKGLNLMLASRTECDGTECIDGDTGRGSSIYIRLALLLLSLPQEGAYLR